MAILKVTNLTFAYDGSYDNVFENISFQLDTDWKLGFTGRNGRGKTTFLKLLMGKYKYSGSISTNVSFEYFPYEVSNKDEFTIDVINSIIYDAQQWEIIRELNLLDISEDVLYRQFDTLSNGEQTKILLAVLFLKENKFLLIDEPTNHLDMAGREIVSEYLNKKKGFILVSHDRTFLDNCIDHVLTINKMGIDVQKGNFSSWYNNKQMQDDFEIKQNERLQKDIKHLETAAMQTAVWSSDVEKTKKGTKIAGLRPDRGRIGHKAAKMMKRSKGIELRQQGAIDEKSKLLKNIESSETLKIHPLIHYANPLIQFENVSIMYGDNVVCENVSFTVENGERVMLSGKNGSGKSSILKLICGEDIKYTGNVQLASNIKISYVSQDTSTLSGNLTAYAMENDIDESLFKAILRKLGFSRTQFEKDMKFFSGGQKKKVLIAKSLCEQAHIYIWDEPLNFIDVISRIQIEELIKKYSPTMLFVEHDSAFCDNILAKITKL